MSLEGRKKRAVRAAGLINALKEGGYPGRIIFFSDEKTFVVDPAFNPQNDRYIEFYSDSSEGDESEEEAAITKLTETAAAAAATLHLSLIHI